MSLEERLKQRQENTYAVGGAAEMDKCCNAAPNEDYLLNELFSYHRPVGDDNLRYENIRAAAKAFAKTVLVNVPTGADRTAAIRKIREAVMTANAAVALQGVSL